MDFWQDWLSVTVFPSGMTAPSPRHVLLKKEEQFFVFFPLQCDSLWSVGQSLTVPLSGLDPTVSARMAVCTQTSACLCLRGPGAKGVATISEPHMPSTSATGLVTQHRRSSRCCAHCAYGWLVPGGFKALFCNLNSQTQSFGVY